MSIFEYIDKFRYKTVEINTIPFLKHRISGREVLVTYIRKENGFGDRKVDILVGDDGFLGYEKAPQYYHETIIPWLEKVEITGAVGDE